MSRGLISWALVQSGKVSELTNNLEAQSAGLPMFNHRLLAGWRGIAVARLLAALMGRG